MTEVTEELKIQIIAMYQAENKVLL